MSPLVVRGDDLKFEPTNDKRLIQILQYGQIKVLIGVLGTLSPNLCQSLSAQICIRNVKYSLTECV